MTGSLQLRTYLHRRQTHERAEAASLAGIGIEEARLTDIAQQKGELGGVEPLDPAIAAIGHNNPPEGNMSTSIAADELRLLIERVERLEEEKKALSDDIKDVYGEAKARGYDTRTMRECVKLRKLETHVRQEREALLDTYKAALGLDYCETPLGSAAMRSAMEKTVDAINDGALGPGVTATFHPAH